MTLLDNTLASILYCWKQNWNLQTEILEFICFEKKNTFLANADKS